MNNEEKSEMFISMLAASSTSPIVTATDPLSMCSENLSSDEKESVILNCKVRGSAL